MATYTRKNAWLNGGTFDNEDILWYAKGVAVMQSRQLSDPTSWWFFAAIHGEYIKGETSFPGWAYIPGPPQVPVTPVPAQSVQDQYWNQCQHQSWYFTPWHRGYLVALEKQIRTAIVSLGGPATWALPYWNYFGPNNEYKIPPAFTQRTLPDGTTANPLFAEARYGPKNNGDIYIPIPPVEESCQSNTIFTGSNSATKLPGYGGPKTGFSNAGNISGNLESNPHNKVHTNVGGNDGIMSDPGTAGLDPIFYFHHSNIDRLWASWNAAGNTNPTDANWLSGPASAGEREFVMPLPDGSAWVYTPADVDSMSKMDYVYDDMTPAIAAPLVSKLAQRLTNLGVALPALKTLNEDNMDLGSNTELVGANKEALQVKTSGVRTSVALDPKAWQKVPDSLLNASVTSVPDRVYLQIENVKGNMDSNNLNISLNHQQAGSVSLFGLRKASKSDSHHGGDGLTFLLDITDVIDKLHLNNALSTGALDVMILPDNEITEAKEITIGRVSVYREGQK